jgi:hypothetical protein
MIILTKEEIAFIELKNDIVKLLFKFNDKYAVSGEDTLYPKVGTILVNVLTECLSEAQYQVKNYHPFTPKQIDHICYKIGEWYFLIKPLLEGSHNLGFMKERLKIMICGE